MLTVTIHPEGFPHRGQACADVLRGLADKIERARLGKAERSWTINDDDCELVAEAEWEDDDDDE